VSIYIYKVLKYAQALVSPGSLVNTTTKRIKSGGSSLERIRW
jgi:hypothetical protein